ncbi:MAG: hypothetical protein ACE5OQ_12060 [Woeseia sp.]
MRTILILVVPFLGFGLFIDEYLAPTVFEVLVLVLPGGAPDGQSIMLHPGIPPPPWCPGKRHWDQESILARVPARPV